MCYRAVAATTDLMVDIVEICVVVCEQLKRIPGQLVTTVIINSLESCQDEEEGCLSSAETRYGFAHSASETIKQETLDRMVIQCSESIRHVKPVMYAVKISIKKW